MTPAAYLELRFDLAKRFRRDAIILLNLEEMATVGFFSYWKMFYLR